MELRDYIRLLRRRWVLILVVLLACLGGAAAATLLQDKTYRSSTEILVALSDSALVEEPGSATYYLPDRVKSFATILGTQPVLQAALESAGLPPDADVSVTASAEEETSILVIDVVASDPADAQVVASSYATVMPLALAGLNQVTSPNELTFETLRAAPLPTTPYRPDPISNGAIGLAAGLILGIAAAVLREALDRRIRDSRSIEEDTDQALLGVIPLQLRKEPLPANSHPVSLRTEAYRTVRTNLLFSGLGEGLRSFAITSPSSGEGKSALASNLAIVFASTGQSVALVDADLRRPTLHRHFQCSGDVGLSSVLGGDVRLDDALHHVGTITLLPSGPMTRSPSELLGQPMLRQVIEKLEGSHDIVIVDTAPTLPVADAVLVSAHVGGVVVVGRLGSTTIAGLKRTLATLSRSRAHVLGIVLSGFDEDPDTGYGYAYAASKQGRRRPRPELRQRGARRGRR